MLLVITDTGNSVFTPAIYPTACVLVWKIIPGLTMLTIVFPHCTPLAFAKVWPPFSPAGLLQPVLFCIHDFYFYVLSLCHYIGRCCVALLYVQFNIQQVKLVIKVMQVK